MVDMALWLLVLTATGAGVLFFVSTAPARPRSPSPFVGCDECLNEVRATCAERPRCGARLAR